MSELLSGLANFTKTVKGSLNTYEIRKLGDKVQGMVMNYTEPETKVREATNEEPWGPTGPQMSEIAHLTYQYDAFPEVMGMLWKRMLQDNKSAWRRVYKSLILLNHLVRNGSDRVITNARDHLFDMRSLESYKYTDERGRDQGANVRHRAKLIIELIQDDEMLRAERRKAKLEGKEKYRGYSKDDMRFGGSSKISNFNEWNDCPDSRDTRFDRRDQFRDREVNSFQFPDDEIYRGNDSPELGIREPSPVLKDEGQDEFGEFAQARNVVKKGCRVTNQSTIVPFPIPPPANKIAPPVATKKTIQSDSQTVFIKEDSSVKSGDQDLLGLGVEAAVGSQTNDQMKQAPSESIDFFSLNSNALLSDETFPEKDEQEEDIFGDFKSSGVEAPPAHKSFACNFESTEEPLNISMDNLQISSPSQGIDLTSPAAMGLNFLLDPTPAVTIPATPLVPMSSAASDSIEKVKLPTPATVASQEVASKATPKMPSTWSSDLSKVNIDVDNLITKKNVTKQSVSMNEMMRSATGSSNTAGSFLHANK